MKEFKKFNGTDWQTIQPKKYDLKKISGTPPFSFESDGRALQDWSITGQTVQDGTPTPENPIVPSGCGELETTGVHAGQYKLPILSNSTVTNIYLGEAATTRRIKKYVFTGEENGTLYSTGTSRKGIEITGIPGIIGGNANIAILAICTHYRSNTRSVLYRNTNNGISNAFQNDNIIFYDANYQTVEAFQQFCAQQYAAGTPVKVWYVLAEPETGIVNEPLMKIGSYADEINLTNSGVNIPTIEGSNTLTVNTTIQPSSMSIKKGLWKDCSLYEYTPYVSGVPPFTFKSDGQNLRNWSITGQTVQNGAPTPESPIMPSGCGERTENLFDIASTSEPGYISDDGILFPSALVTTYDYIDVTGNTEVSYKAFTLTSGNRGTIRIAYYDENKSFLSRYVQTNMALQWTTVTLPSDCVYVRLSLDNNLSDIMFTAGSTPPTSYIPYGYKLPLAVNGVEHPIYLGEVETTRKIKKLVLTGEENWVRATNGTFYSYFVTDYYNLEGRITICSHYIGDTNRSSTATVNDKACCFRISDTKTIYIRDTSFNSVTEFITYLAAQYAAGTPVTVWYVLAEPEAAVVNEPLMKIGDYADEISKTGTSMNIPTASGSNTLTISTTVQPSEMTIESISQWIKQN